ncbi:MAG: hypothetical protein HN509_02755 [Halobacteriovoraceae bacterium]|nr:hypothetical protein [Halobacteriovoraceae bacterium]MBT5094072.1 hypothetical protein [Halobacteriovoraceae bacterium]
MDRTTECCGANLKTERISILGMLTLSLPLLAISLLLMPLSWPLQFLGLKKLHQVNTIILRANMDLIQSSSILPNLKCNLSGRFYRISPWLSGFNFRYFNLIILSGFFFTILSGAFIVIRVWP